MTIRDNLLVLRAAIEAQPDENIDLAHIRCGTHYCAAGIVGITPHFQALGFSLRTAGKDSEYSQLLHGEQALVSTPLNNTFGDCAWRRLFDTRGEGSWDLGLDTEGMTDKVLALARIDLQLREYPA